MDVINTLIYQTKVAPLLNFLAHLYLSGHNDSLKIGNFIGDFMKGNQIFDFPEDIQRGILHHRKIDDFTDTHPIVLQSKKRLRLKYRHYAPVIVDMFYDHFLARRWNDYSDVPLKDFTTNFYQIAQKKSHYLPEKALFVLSHMSKTDWLYNYQFVEGIDKALTGMAKRTKFESKMEHATHDLQVNYEFFENEFVEFFDDIREQLGH